VKQTQLLLLLVMMPPAGAAVSLVVEQAQVQGLE